jgi:hypothetical protein
MTTKQLTAALGMALVCGWAGAQQIEVREQVSVEVPKSLFGSSPSAELKQEARKQAVDRAWRRYQSQNFSGARARQALENESALRPLADQYCSFNVTEEKFDRDAGKLSIEIRGSCDQRAIDAAFAKMLPSTVQTAQGGARARGPLVSFVFLARRAASETNERESASTVSTSGAESSSDTQRSARGGARSIGSEDASVTQRARTSTTSSDADFKFEVEGTDDAMTAVANVLTTNSFRVARYPELVTQCPGPSMGDLARRYAEMKVNTAWNPKDTKGMLDSARQCRVPYFAFGLTEVMKSQQTSRTGYTVVVALNLKVNDLSELVPSECASINSQYQGTGKDRLEATRNALQVAAEQGTRELVDIMRQNCL